jgi:hypothetical protein
VTFVGLSISPGNPTLVISTDAELQLRAIAQFSDESSIDRTETAAWSSSDASVIAVSNAPGTKGASRGGAAAGTATITATDEATGAIATIAVVVTEAVVTSIVIEPDAAATPAGYGLPFTAKATYSDTSGEALDVTDLVEWSSSIPQIASISNDPVTRGVATGAAPGQTTITATIPGGMSASASLTVTEALLRSITVVALNAQPDRIPKGFPVELRAMGGFSDGTAQDVTTFVEWATSDGSVAEISNAAGSVGVATGLAVGAATITATTGEVSGSIDLSFTAAELVSLIVDAAPGRPFTWSGTSTRFSARGTFSDGAQLELTRDVTWAVSPEVGTFSTVPGKQAQLLAVTATTTPVTITATDAASGVSDSFEWSRVRARNR